MITQKEWLHAVFLITKKIKAWHLDYLVLLPISFFVASQIIIPMPFFVVPLSLQPLPIFFAAWFLGKRGVAGYAMYLMQGAAGLPIFSGFSGGFLHLFGPTGGYLIGFLFGGVLITAMRSHMGRPFAVYCSYVCVMMIVFLFGIAQLSTFFSLKIAILQGFFPFIIGDFFLKPLVFIGVSLVGQLEKNI